MKSPSFALITGASQGLGRVFARALAARGQNVILVARSRDKLESLANELRSSCLILAEVFEFDLASQWAGQRLAQQLRDRNLKVNLLINNAGFGVRGEFRNLAASDGNAVPEQRYRRPAYIFSFALVDGTSFGGNHQRVIYRRLSAGPLCQSLRSDEIFSNEFLVRTSAGTPIERSKSGHTLPWADSCRWPQRRGEKWQSKIWLRLPIARESRKRCVGIVGQWWGTCDPRFCK